ncbi:alpha-1,2-fucosyltransferase [Flavisolibacter nicotianae]|uniref:alpha-1,2-fucosyltransferase n=1 Tax=Flavisolibacter nicotianae TaxID=2364882 RepID=UPI000EB36574|nr:alpha-1,2-fucosyltransferase [Flavisolibacter nicotianae]
MIVSKLYGGLAGQMLQYALGRNLSLKNQTELYLDLSWYKSENQNSTFPRTFKLDKLNVQYKEVDYSRLYWKIRTMHRLKSLNPFSLVVVKEKDFSRFDPSIIETKNNSVLDGYFNSYKYFEEVRDCLLREFTPNEQPNQKNSSCLHKIRATNAVSVHFRRGDYALTSFHGMLTKDYYEAAIDKICSQLADPYLYIFSDEPEWVIDNIRFPFNYEVVNFNRDENNYWDMELMKNCRHNIIANSGFSWWGAWLNQNPEKTVVAPKVWIAEQEREMNDFIPKEWIRL